MIIINRVVKYTIPLYGNNHYHPYGKIEITNGKITKIVNFNNWSFTFNRKRYNITNKGSLYRPCLIIVE
ncbi:MAG TPA: hypothetical protein DDW20_01420 [Firmicutes bacterium]|nr:hypothetical protein [Bacillota bacterium]